MLATFPTKCRCVNQSSTLDTPRSILCFPLSRLIRVLSHAQNLSKWSPSWTSSTMWFTVALAETLRRPSLDRSLQLTIFSRFFHLAPFAAFDECSHLAFAWINGESALEKPVDSVFLDSWLSLLDFSSNPLFPSSS